MIRKCFVFVGVLVVWVAAPTAQQAATQGGANVAPPQGVRAPGQRAGVRITGDMRWGDSSREGVAFVVRRGGQSLRVPIPSTIVISISPSASH